MVTAPILPTLVLMLLRGCVPPHMVSSIPFEWKNRIIPVVLRIVRAIIRRTTNQKCMVDLMLLMAVFLPTFVLAPLRCCVTSDVVSSNHLWMTNDLILVFLLLLSAIVLLLVTEICVVCVVVNFLLQRVYPLLPGSSLVFYQRNVSNYIAVFLVYCGVIFQVYLHFEYVCILKCRGKHY